METKEAPSKLFITLSWGFTSLVVGGLLAGAFWYLQTPAQKPPLESQTNPISAVPTEQLVLRLPAPDFVGSFAISRKLKLKTVIPDRPRYAVMTHVVERGDSLYGIAKAFDIKPETVLWANYPVLEDDPHSLKPGQELLVPPTDGVLYEWKDGDTLEKVAAENHTSLDDALTWPGNNLDLTTPRIKAGQLVMFPGGWRKSKAIELQVDDRGAGTGTTGVAGSVCGGGVAGTGAFGWPTNSGLLSGNDYFPGHLGIDLAGAEGDPVFASDGGVVIKAAGGWNGGYGNVVAIDHGNGYVTVYAHLSATNVRVCQNVGKGAVIGAVGNTGNSFGSHLHFEVRQGGGNINPWFVFQ